MPNTLDWLIADWPAPNQIRAGCTFRSGGISRPPYDAFNLGDHVGDDAHAVKHNRALLKESLSLPNEPLWLSQQHTTDIVQNKAAQNEVAQYDISQHTIAKQSADGVPPPLADASFAQTPGKVCVVLTADCLPVLFCDQNATVVAAAHAGWRGLAAGVLEHTVRAMGVDPKELMAWFGPAIGPQVFEVGDEVRLEFMQHDSQAKSAFSQMEEGHWKANLYELARQRLASVGVSAIYGGEHCTYTEQHRYFSYRRDGVTGRQASLIWIDHGL